MFCIWNNDIFIFGTIKQQTFVHPLPETHKKWEILISYCIVARFSGTFQFLSII